MSPEEALQTVANGCARMQGNLYDHQRLQEALTVIGDIINPQPQPTTEDTDGSS